MVKESRSDRRQGDSKRRSPAETDLACGQGCAGGPERVASGIGRDQNERQDNRKRTHMGR